MGSELTAVAWEESWRQTLGPGQRASSLPSICPACGQLRSLALPFSVMEWALPPLAARGFPDVQAPQDPRESPPFGTGASGSMAGSASPSQPGMPGTQMQPEEVVG